MASCGTRFSVNPTIQKLISRSENCGILSLRSKNNVSFGSTSISISISRVLKVDNKMCANVCLSSTPQHSTIDVNLETHSYPIYVGPGLLNQPQLLHRHLPGEKVLVVTNTTVAPLYLDKVINALTHENSNIIVETLIFPDGEEHKNQRSLYEIFRRAYFFKMAPTSTIVALGGGVISDLCGCVAWCLWRGTNFIHIPTTLMAQVDLPIGGKNFVNVTSKGYVHESSYQPQCVLIDTNTLNTLPNRELASGIAEVVKYGIIKDAKFFEWQEKNVSALLARDPSAMSYAIKRSCEIKTEIVSLEKEDGLKGTLNLGHTFSHALEVGLGAGQWLHGEAVAVGMLMAVNMSYLLGWISKSTAERIFNILRSAKLPTTLPPNKMTVEMFTSYMAADKKVAGGLLRLILLKGPLGNCVSTVDYDRKALDDALHGFCTS